MADDLVQPHAVVLLSGGLDSTVLAYLLASEGYRVDALSIQYGQRHSTEIDHARATANRVGASWREVDLSSIQSLLSSSSLTGSAPVPEGHYTAMNMASTVVPNRNAIFLAVAYGYAVNIGAKAVCTAVHSGDHAIYPDCRPDFIMAFEAMEKESITREIYGVSAPKLRAPFIGMTKEMIVRLGSELGVPFQETWSCYKGDLAHGHCGRCGTCVERVEAFALAGVVDPTRYDDKEFAKTVLAKV